MSAQLTGANATSYRCPMPPTGPQTLAPLPSGGRRPATVLATFVIPGVLWLLAGLVAGALALGGLGGTRTGWLAFHMVFAGGISQVLLGAAQFFSTAYLATDPPPPATVRIQSALWNSGVLLLALGLPFDVGALSALGGVLLLVGLGFFVGSLRALQCGSLRRPRWTLRWYHAAAALLAAGALLGALLAEDVLWTHGSLTAAHITCNVLGWLGGAIVGTLHTLHPTLHNTQLARPQLEGRTFVCWNAGVVALACGFAFTLRGVVVVGWVLLLTAALLLLVNVVLDRRASESSDTWPARLVDAGQLLLPVGLACGLVIALAGETVVPARGDLQLLGLLLGGGWIGLTFAGSLLRLTRVLLRVRRI